MSLSLKEAQEEVALVEKSKLIFALTHNYTGYPMVRQARDMVRNGALGEIRKVFVEYIQGWFVDAQLG
jgi:predicted dehydrogenase